MFTDPFQLQQAALTSSVYTQVQCRMFRQLMESLLYEGLISLECKSSPHCLTYIFEGKTLNGSPVRYHAEGNIYFSFSRIKLCEKNIKKYDHNGEELPLSIIDFIDEISDQLKTEPFYIQRCKNELERTLVNDVVAQFAWQKQDAVLRDQSYDTIETSLSHAHPYHPCYKSRIGFTIEDNLAFAPEFSHPIYPIVLAVHKDISEISYSSHINLNDFYDGEIPSSAMEALRGQCGRFGYSPENYFFIPVHPWQWQNIIASHYSQEMRMGLLIYLGEMQDKYFAQQSIRTLVNGSHPEKYNVKCAMSIQNTSSSRILSPHTVKNASIVSDWLMDIYKSDPYLSEDIALVLLPEVAGVTVSRPHWGGEDIKYGALSCIWRQSLHSYLASNEDALPFSAISVLDRDSRPIIYQWIEKYPITEWVTALLKVTTVPLLHLLFRHGVGLEAHGQNVILIHEDGFPKRLALKDFHDGVRFVSSMLEDEKKKPKLHDVPSHHLNINRNSYIEVAHPEHMRDFLLDALYFINLSEIAIFLATYYQFSEQEFWAIARQVILDYQSENKDLADRFTQLDIFIASIEVEQLTKRRLFPDDGAGTHSVPNPLATHP